MRTTAMKQRMGLDLSDAPEVLTKQLQDQFIESLKAGGRQKQTIRTYRHCIEELYEYLPPDKEIHADTLKEWKQYLKDSGYSDSTVNIRITAANVFLRFCGREELATAHEHIASDAAMPEMTRTEYLEFLSAVREMGSAKYYFLIKVFANLDVGIGELQYLTVEACQEGIVYMPDGKTAAIPACLREELLQYAAHEKISKGPLFLTRTGVIPDRSNITNAIHRLAVKAGMDPKKCCPSALHRVYLTTQEEIMERVRPICIQSYESLLNTEQMVVGWKG